MTLKSLAMAAASNVQAQAVKLNTARVDFHNASNAHISAKWAYENCITQGIMNGKIDGKNPETRAAQAQTLFPGLFNALKAAETTLKDAQLKLDQEKTTWEALALEIRSLEIAANVDALDGIGQMSKALQAMSELTQMEINRTVIEQPPKRW